MNTFETLVHEILSEGLYDPHVFKAVFMAGPLGAGKSTVARQLLGGSGLRSLNIDNFSEMMIKKGQVPGGNLSPEQLETSWELVQQQKKNFLEGRLGLLIDGSGRNVQDIRENMDMLLQLGYDVACVFVNVDLNVSMARAAQRSQQQAAKHGTGRNVPEDLQRMAHGAVQRNVPRLKELFGNNFFEVDNTSTPDLRDVQKRINSWLRTPPSKPQALEWIRSQQIQRKR